LRYFLSEPLKIVNIDNFSEAKGFRKTYITQEDLFINGGISMQHSNYNITSKNYIDKRVIAKEVMKKGFRVFPKQSIE
jgi:hypothetical protein